MVKKSIIKLLLFKVNKYPVTVCIYCLLILFMPSSASAVSDFEIAIYMQSLNTLPAYCQYRLAETRFRNECTDINGNKTWPPAFGKSRSYWENYVGFQNWQYIHHYCFGIREFMDYSRLSNEEKKMSSHRLKKALEEFEFMRAARTSGFRFWYDLYRYEGYIYLLLGNTAKAEWALKQSLKYKKQNN